MLALLALLASGILFASLGQGNLVNLRANAGCSFHLSTNGGPTPFWVGQLPNGQCGAGGGLRSSSFTWFGDAFVDQQGRGCWWTPPSSVLQCDANQQPSHGFDIGCDGRVSYNGQSTFYQCRTGDGDQVNIYLQPVGDQCQAITLVSDACNSCQNSPSLTAAPQPATTPSVTISTVTPFTTAPVGQSSPAAGNPSNPSGNNYPSPSPSSNNPTANPRPQPTALPPPAKDCPADLTGSYEYPRLLVPIDRASPDKAYGSTLYGQVSPNASTIFNFAITPSDAGRSCKVFFSFPSRYALAQVSSSDFYFSGDGSVLFSRLGGPADLGTTWNGLLGSGSVVGAGMRTLGALRLSPGNTYVLETFDCPAGQTVTYMMSEPVGGDTCLVYLQDWIPTEIGMFISTC
ncbi:ubiquitin 3 binding protein But2 C-terminal domain-containing protein [Xylariales sp. AK1849]|nr:ubiquitin 3 binding protein But2 C-terminal domain-containing protein [Xylariales sp. AK1849]